MACLVCGAAPTVRSHLVPRALFHRMKRGGGQSLIASRQHGGGYDLLQSGHSDRRLLCVRHEAELGAYDDYGVRFARAVHEQILAGKLEFTVANPRPELLVGFAAACVWRAAASRSDLRPARLLGPYADQLAKRLFHGGGFDPLLLISRHAYRLRRGQTLNLGSLPYLYEEEGLRFWRFIACGVIFDLKLDARPPPAAMATLAANKATEITLFDDFPQDALRTPGLAAALRSMSRPRTRP